MFIVVTLADCSEVELLQDEDNFDQAPEKRRGAKTRAGRVIQKKRLLRVLHELGHGAKEEVAGEVNGADDVAAHVVQDLRILIRVDDARA